MSSGSTREFFVYGPGASMTPQGGNSAGCASPVGEPRAVMINVTAVPSTTGGYLKAYPANVSAPNTSLVNFEAGQVVANAGIIKTYHSLGPKELEIFAYKSSHVVIDVMGYFSIPEATMPDYYRTHTTTSIAASTTRIVYSDYCPTGYQWVSAGSESHNSNLYLQGSGQNGSSGRSFCKFRNLSGAAQNGLCAAHCLRIPGI